MRIFMDDNEMYESHNEAALAFSRNIALENAWIDTSLQLEFGIGDNDVFSNYALENIANTVANMASKAKSNIILYTKKLVNMLFGWLVNFFKGGANLKEIMRNNYDKARKYLKKLNEFESKIRAMDQEKEISIRDNGSCVIIGLTVLQVIKTTLDNVQDGIKKLVGNEADSTGTDTDNSSVEIVFGKFLYLMISMYNQLSHINIGNVKELKNSLRANKWNVAGIIAKSGADSLAKTQGELDRASKSSEKAVNNAEKKYRKVKDEEAKQEQITKDWEESERDAAEAAKDKETRKKLDNANESIDWFKYAGAIISMENYFGMEDDAKKVPEGYMTKAEIEKALGGEVINNGDKVESMVIDGTTYYKLKSGAPKNNSTSGDDKTPKTKEELDSRETARKERKAARAKTIITEKEWNVIKTKIELEKKMAVVEKFRNEYKGKVEETVKYMEEPAQSDMSPNTAFDVLRDQLTTYIEFSKANKWNLDQYVKVAEKMRRDMDKALNSFDAENSDETVVKELMTAVLSLGNSFASMQSGVNGIVKRLKVSMDNIFTDTMKLGSAATKIGSSV